MRCQEVIHTNGRCYIWGGQRHHCTLIGGHATRRHRCVCKTEWVTVDALGEVNHGAA